MKKSLYIKNHENKIVYHPEAIVFFSENKIKNGKTKDGKSFMIVPSKQVFLNFKKQFNFSEDLTIVSKHYSNGNLFAYYNNTCEDNESVLGEIISSNGILGDGIYAISEKDFLNNIKTEKMIIDYNMEQLGFKTKKNIISIIQYYGYYYEIETKRHKKLCKLITQNIPFDNIKFVLTENYEICNLV